MSGHNYHLLRTHLYVTHKNNAAHGMGDGEALDYHHEEHHGPGGLRGHLHTDAIPPTLWCTDALLVSPDKPGDPWLTPAEIATEMRVSKMTIYRLIEAGELTATKVGRCYRVRRSTLNQYVERNTKGNHHDATQD